MKETGQYFLIANMTKRQYLLPQDFNESPLLANFGKNSNLMLCLSLLLRNSSEISFNGDITELNDNSLIGTWSNNEISIIGDYDKKKLYDTIICNYSNISLRIKEALTRTHFNNKI